MLSSKALNTSLMRVKTVAAIDLHPILCLNDPYRNVCEAAAELPNNKHES